MKSISVQNLGKRFGDNIILDNITLSLSQGNIYGFIGPNGSGKSVFFKLLAGLVRPTEGEIKIDDYILGKDIDFPDSMGLLIEVPGFLASYSGFQNLFYLSKIKNKIGRKEIFDVLSIMGLESAANKKVGKYSLGMKQRLAIAQAIMEDPELLILDEPMNGLDKKGIQEVRELLISEKRRGKIILLASHTSQDIELLCDSVYEIVDHKMIMV